MQVEKLTDFPNSVSFGTIIGNHNRNPLLIPKAFQRDYEWSETQILELLNDIVAAFEANESKLLHSVVFSSEGRNTYLVDGQQRITTLMIISNALCKGAGVESTLLLDRRADGEGTRIRNTNDDEQNSILDSILMGGCVSGTHPLHICANLVEDYIEGLEYDEPELKELCFFVEEKVGFLQIYVPYKYAQPMYGDINSKGLPLDSVNKLQTYLGGIVKDEDRFIELWSNFKNGISGLNKAGFKVPGKATVQEFIFDLTLKSHKVKLHNESGITVLDKYKVYGAPAMESFIKTYINDKEKVQSFLSRTVDTSSKVLYYITQCKENTFLRYRNKMGTVQYPVLILADLHEIPLSRVSRLLDLIYLTISSDGKSILHKWIDPIIDKIIKGYSIDDIEAWVKYTMKNDPMFDVRAQVENLVYKNNNRKIAGVLLYTEAFLRSKYNNSEFYEEFSKLIETSTTIEHISPQSLGLGAGDGFGNLTLLSKIDNSRIKDKTDTKWAVYSSSDFLLSKIITNNTDSLKSGFNTYVDKWFNRYSQYDLSNFNERMISERGETLINYLTQEIYGL